MRAIILNKQNIVLLVILILLCLTGMLIFTNNAQWSRFNFGKPSEIGDTIGGITAPIINIISAILVFSTIKLQIDTNKNQFEEIADQIQNQEKNRNFLIYNEELRNIENYYKDISYENSVSFVAISESMADLKLMTSGTRRNFGKKINLINTILKSRIYILTNLSSITGALLNKDLHDNERELLSNKTLRFYNAHLKEYDEQLISIKLSPYYKNQIKYLEDLKEKILLITPLILQREVL